MNSNIPRKCFDPGGFVHTFHDGKCRKLAPNVAYVYTGGFSGSARDVTWDEVMADRRERQAKRLEFIRRPAEPKILPCYVWTFLNSGFPYSGWYCYIVTRVTREGDAMAVNFHGLKSDLALSIMTEIPCGFLPVLENFPHWMVAFTKQYPRSRNWPNHKHPDDPRKAGVLHGWLNERRTFSLKHP